MTHTLNTLFAAFDGTMKTEDIPTGFRKNFNYPVFAIDVIVEEGSATDTTMFLLADAEANFVWINAKMLRRKNAPVRAGDTNNTGG